MNKVFTRSALVLALFTPWANAAVNGSDDNCNAGEGLDSWAIWCGVDTYLAQQAPTAAGPIEGGVEGLAEPDVRTVAFGGELVVAEAPAVAPPAVVEPEIEYNWEGYAMLSSSTLGGLRSGELKLKVDTTTGEVTGLLLITASGQEIVFNEDAKFYVPAELIPLINDSSSSPFKEAGSKQISQFEVVSEDLSLKLVTFPQDRRFSNTIMFNSFDQDHAIDSTVGQINTTTAVVGSFAAGSLTPIARMNDFAGQNKVAIYGGYGVYSSDLGVEVGNEMTVNFGPGTWHGKWGQGVASLNIEASGTVEGNKFFSNSVSGLNAEVITNATINGAFNGNNASSLTGVLDVEKNGQRIVGTFKNVVAVP